MSKTYTKAAIEIVERLKKLGLSEEQILDLLKTIDELRQPRSRGFESRQASGGSRGRKPTCNSVGQELLVAGPADPGKLIVSDGTNWVAEVAMSTPPVAEECDEPEETSREWFNRIMGGF